MNLKTTTRLFSILCLSREKTCCVAFFHAPPRYSSCLSCFPASARRASVSIAQGLLTGSARLLTNIILCCRVVPQVNPPSLECRSACTSYPGRRNRGAVESRRETHDVSPVCVAAACAAAPHTTEEKDTWICRSYSSGRFAGIRPLRNTVR